MEHAVLQMEILFAQALTGIEITPPRFLISYIDLETVAVL